MSAERVQPEKLEPAHGVEALDLPYTFSLHMKAIVSGVITCPGTMFGKPGGYSMTNFARYELGTFLQSPTTTADATLPTRSPLSLVISA